MSIGIGQIILILLIILIVFGKFPNVLQDITTGIQNIKDIINNNSDRIEDGGKK